MITWSHGIHYQEATVDESKLSLSSVSLYSLGCQPGSGATCGVCFFFPQQNQDNLLTGRPTGPPPRQFMVLSSWQLSVPWQCPQALKPTCLCSTTSKDWNETNRGTIIFPFEFVTLEHNVSPPTLQNSLHLQMEIKKYGRPIFILNMRLIFLVSVT